MPARSRNKTLDDESSTFDDVAEKPRLVPEK